MNLKRARVIDSDDDSLSLDLSHVPCKRLKTRTTPEKGVKSSECLPLKKRPILSYTEKENLVITKHTKKLSPAKTMTGCEGNILKSVNTSKTADSSSEELAGESDDDDDDFNEMFVTLKSKGIKTNITKKSPNIISPQSSSVSSGKLLSPQLGKSKVRHETSQNACSNTKSSSRKSSNLHTPISNKSLKIAKSPKVVSKDWDTTPRKSSRKSSSNLHALISSPDTTPRKSPRKSSDLQVLKCNLDTTPRKSSRKSSDVHTLKCNGSEKKGISKSVSSKELNNKSLKSAKKQSKAAKKLQLNSPTHYELDTTKKDSDGLKLNLKKTQRDKSVEQQQGNSTEKYMLDLCDKSPSELILNFKRTPKKKVRDFGNSQSPKQETPKSANSAKTTDKTLKGTSSPVSSEIKKSRNVRSSDKRKSVLCTPENKKSRSLKRKLIDDAVTATSATPEPKTPRTPLEKARASLHVSAVPDSLPCREKEFSTVVRFLTNRLQNEVGGCMYISGVPGTGKTATVTQAVRRLQQDNTMPQFRFIEMNGMRLSDPRQAYVELWKHLTESKQKISAEQSQRKLDAFFNKADRNRLTTVLLIDELDLICTKKQDVVYNLLDWPTRTHSQLVVLAVANTMDMPERMLKGRVTSRLGLTRLMFHPYTHKQLEEIVLARLEETNSFDADAVRLVTRKVAGVSGDARRALDICRRATEMPAPHETVTIAHIEKAIKEMTNSNVVLMLRGLSEMEKLFLKAMADVSTRSGLDEVTFLRVLEQLSAVVVLDGLPKPSVSQVLALTHHLTCSRVLFSNPPLGGVLQKLMFNVTQDDIHYALRME